MALLLSACDRPGSVTDTGGFVFNRICISKDDKLTDFTGRQVLDHNEIGAKLYGWQSCKAAS